MSRGPAINWITAVDSHHDSWVQRPTSYFRRAVNNKFRYHLQNGSAVGSANGHISVPNMVHHSDDAPDIPD